MEFLLPLRHPEKLLKVQNGWELVPEFVLYDIQGRVILRKDLDLNSTINTIDTTNFSNGVYLVQLTSKTNSLSKKLIIR